MANPMLRAGHLVLAMVLASAWPPMTSAQSPALPSINPGLGDLGGLVRDPLRSVTDLGNAATALADGRIERIGRFVHAHRDRIELNEAGEPARAHEVLVLDPDAAMLRIATTAGFGLIEQGDAGDLGVAYARLSTPAGASLSTSIRGLRRLLSDRTVTADVIHFTSGAMHQAVPASASRDVSPHDAAVGIIDGGVPPTARIFAQAGFATGAPHADGHAQAIISLLAGAGMARIAVADVYGTDAGGGSALAIARALGWMQARGVRVVSISLVGPANPLLARVVAAVQSRGLIVVAAVGNDGAAAPPAYPASYPGVIAVTGVDGHHRVLFEAGHALHIDYAAPGADLTAIDLDGHARRLRGTSFAAPLVAARLATLGAGANGQVLLLRAEHEAIAPGPRTGHGILCDTCRHGI